MWSGLTAPGLGRPSTAALCAGAARGPSAATGAQRAGPGRRVAGTGAAAEGAAPRTEAGTPPETGAGNPTGGSVPPQCLGE